MKVHTDSRAAELARGVRALAFTSGDHIAFDTGRYAPGTPAGRALLFHELTHVVQQRRPSLATPSGDDVCEREASAIANASTRGGGIATVLDADLGGSSPAFRRQPSAGASPRLVQRSPAPPLRPLDYDMTPLGMPAVPMGQTVASITIQLNAKVKAGDITSFAIVGARPGGNAEIFLLSAIYAIGDRKRWGAEFDIVTAIDWPANPGRPAPQGLVTVRIDSRGAASAELIAAGGVPAVAQATIADATAKLTADFGFAAVTGWTGSNAAAELSDVLAALALLKSRAPGDIPALKGVELIRVASLGDKTAGEFSVGTAGQKPSLKLADRAFGGRDTQFFGGGPSSPPVPASFQVILHEVGHAVEKEEFRSAQERYGKATEEREAARKALQVEGSTYDAEFQEAKRKGTLAAFWKRRAAAHKKNEEAEAKAATRVREEAGKVEATRVDAPAVQPFEAAAAASSASAAGALTTAKRAVQALRPEEVQSSAAYVQAIDDTAAAITTFAADAKSGPVPIEDLELAVLQKATDRDRAHFELLKPQPPHGITHRAIFPLDAAVQAQDAWFEAERDLARARMRTRRLQKFIDMVTANNIRRFTQYSVENWRLKPAEFYAEAYSLWLVDPDFLETNYKVVYDFFRGGNYRP